MPPKTALLFAAALVLPFSLLACGDDDDDGEGASPADGISEVTRQVLNEAASDVVQGQLLELTRVIIPAGDDIAPHTHPGQQLAYIAEGTLTYTVLSGEALVTRDAGSEDAEVVTVTAGETIEIATGDSVAETPGMAHEARNDGDVAVVIYLSSFFPEGVPASSPAEE